MFTGSTIGRHASLWLIVVAVLELGLSAFFVFLAFTVPIAAEGFYLTAAILGITGLVLLLIGLRVRASAAATEQLLSAGLAGQAQITGLTQTGMYLNEQPQVSMDLLVSLPDRPPYAAKRKEFVPLILLGRLTSGAPLPVRVDPADPQRVVIDWANVGLVQPAFQAPFGQPMQPMQAGQPMQPGTATSPGSGMDESLAQVQAALASSGSQAAAPSASPAQAGYTVEALREYLRANGIEGSARINKAHDTGQIVGDERLYTMKVTLELPGRPPQQLAESASMVPIRAMHKVQVGWKVPVRVAPDNPNLMMFEWDKL